MATGDNDIRIDIEADVSGLKRGTAEAEAAVKALGRSFKEPSAALENVSTKSDRATASFSRMGAGIGLAVGSTAAAVLTLAKHTIDAADALSDMSVRTGVSVKDLAGLKLIAEQSGTSLDAVGKGVQRLTLSIGQAQQGSKEYAAALKRLGVDSADPKEAFYQLADAVKSSHDPTQHAADLQKVLSRNYAELLPLLNEGGDGLRRAAQESEGFADAMARLAPDADRFNDNLATMKTNVTGVSAALLAEMVPALNEVFDRIVLVKDLIGAGGLFNTLNITAGTDDLAEVMRRLRQEIDLTQQAIDGKKGRGLDSSAFEEKQRGLQAQLQVLLDQQVKGLMAPPETEIMRLLKASRAEGGGAIDSAPGKTRSIDQTSLYNDEMARNAKLIADETERIAGDYAFMAQVDVAQNPAEFQQAWVDAGRALEVAMRTPQESANIAFGRLDEMLDQGVISWETYSRAVLAEQDKLDEALQKTAKTGEDAFADLKQAVEGWGKDASAAFADWAMGAEVSISDVGRAWAREMIQMAAYKSIFEPLAGVASNFITNLFPSAKGNAFEGPSGMSAYRNSVVDRPTVVALAKGAALIGEKPGSPGEAVMPLTRMRDGDLGVKVGGAGGGMTLVVNLIESPGNGGKTEQRQDGNGNNMLDIYVEKIKDSIAGDINSGRGAVPNALSGAYGLNRVAGGY